MAHNIDSKLAELGVTLPEAPAPAAAYVPYVISGDLIFVSGQLPKDADGLITGKLGADTTIERGQQAAKVCAINLLAQVKQALGGDLDRVTRVVRLGGFVNATADFTDHPKVINGASEFLGAVFGDKGTHARAAVGSSSLPFGVAVEIEGVFEFR